MASKPWHTVVSPREDLREGRPLDASEFAVHLDQVRDGRAPGVYQQPEQFFARTFLTKNLTTLAVETLRRLSGITTETSAVFNMSTQFGGGKTHALTLLYHLARSGTEAAEWAGVQTLLDSAHIARVPQAATAVFVGTEFDSITGRGGEDDTPLRRTPWGEIAYQLGGVEALGVLAEHEQQMTAPGGDVIERFLPSDQSCLILLDELMNYVTRSRRSGMAAQLYTFIQNLSEVTRGRANTVLAVAIPASELEMSADDQSDFERLKKLLDRVGKPIIISAETETSEIIRRRLFEWDDPRAVSSAGRVLLNREAIQTCREYAEWEAAHRHDVPSWFPVDRAREAFEASYPFHPSVLSVFERKWRALPRFQQTRGVLRLLALWVSRAYQESYKGARRDALITLGTAPLDDTLFRTAALEQLGEPRLEGAITTDICGKPDAHALRLDDAAQDTVRRARLHRKVATTIFFESNGGQLQDRKATLPEIRLAVGGPDTDLGFIEPALEALTNGCYFLAQERNDYYFSLRENLNKRFADRRASVSGDAVMERVRTEIQKAFTAGTGVERIYFPERSNQVPDRAALALVVLAPERSLAESATLPFIKSVTRESGSSARTFKSALLWAVAESDGPLKEDARKLLAWKAIQDEQLALDELQQAQLRQSLERAARDLREAVWRSYKSIVLLGKDNQLRTIDLGLVHSSAAPSLVELFLNRLRQDGELVEAVSPNFLVRNWPPAFLAWSTRAVRDAFYASPQFPRLTNAAAVQAAVARGVSDGILAYVGQLPSGEYRPFHYSEPLAAAEIELSPDMYVITRETAEAYRAAQVAPEARPAPTQPAHVAEHTAPYTEPAQPEPASIMTPDPERIPTTATAPEQPSLPVGLQWTGEIPWQKWTNFYMKVLTKFSADAGLKLTVTVRATPAGGISQQALDEMRAALRELSLADDVQIE